MSESAATTTQQAQFEFDKTTRTSYIGTSDDGKVYYAGDASNKWCIGEVPNGGYVLSLITDAVLHYFSTKHQTDPVALNGFYMRKTDVGPFVVEIQNMKMTKKGYCLARASLLQAKGMPQLADVKDFEAEKFVEKVQVIFTMGNFDDEKGVTHFHEPYQAPDPSKMSPYNYTYMGEYVDAMVDQSTFPDDIPNGKGVPEFHQSLKFSDDRNIDFKSIPFWCDMFLTPPLLLGLDFLGGPVWCPTMQLEVQFKQKPYGKQVLTSIVAPHIINGRFDCSGGVWDAEGNLFALTRHQCLIVPWSRNVKSGAKSRL